MSDDLIHPRPGNPDGMEAFPTRTSVAGTRRVGGSWMAILGGALLAGLISFGVGEATYGLFRWNDARDVISAYSNELNRLGPYERNAFITTKMMSARGVMESRKAAVGFGTLGALLGLALGLAGSSAASGSGRGNRGPVLGLVLGGAAGALTPLVCVPLFYQFYEPGGGLATPIAAYAGVLLPLGAAVGLAFGFGLSDSRAMASSILGAVLGAAVGVMVVVMVNSLAFPLDQEPALVPGDRLARLVIHLGPAICVALFVALTVARSPEKPRARTT